MDIDHAECLLPEYLVVVCEAIRPRAPILPSEPYQLPR